MFTTRRNLFAIVAIVVFAAVAPAPLDAQSAPTGAAGIESVKAAELARRDALLAADTVALSKLVAAEFYEVSRFGTIRPRMANMREVSTGALKLTDIKYDSATVQLHGDIAIYTAIADNVGTFQGQPFTGKIRLTRVFVWRDGRWQAVAMHQTPMQ
jgi:hypothetical protein